MSDETNTRLTAEEELSALRVPVPPKLEVVPKVDLDDLSDLRIDPSVLEGVAAKVPLSIPVRKPPRQEFIRVRPEPEFRLTVGAVTFREEDEFYLASTEMGARLIGVEAGLYTLFVYINRGGVLRLWPIRQADTGGKQNEWHRTAEKAAQYAMRSWVRVVPNKGLGGYEIMEAAVRVPDPVWPELSMPEIIRVALREKGMIIDSPDHPAVRKLEGRL
jgi:hypothetical protein